MYRQCVEKVEEFAWLSRFRRMCGYGWRTGDASAEWRHRPNGGLFYQHVLACLSGRDRLGSVLASMFGVQSNRKREQDFTHGKPSHYVMVGLLVTIVFVLVVWAVVQVVMKVAGV